MFLQIFLQMLLKMKTSTRDFLSYQKITSPMDVFIILQLSANDFPLIGKRKNNNITINLSRSDILTSLTLLSADAKLTLLCVLLRVLLTKDKVCNFPLLHFPRWFCLIHGQLGMSLECLKRSVMFKCQCFCLFDI